jgi:hypothetical protein
LVNKTNNKVASIMLLLVSTNSQPLLQEDSLEVSNSRALLAECLAVPSNNSNQQQLLELELACLDN